MEPVFEKDIGPQIQSALRMLDETKNNPKQLYNQIQNVIDRINTRSPMSSTTAIPPQPDALRLFSATDPLALIYENVNMKNNELEQYAQILKHEQTLL